MSQRMNAEIEELSTRAARIKYVRQALKFSRREFAELIGGSARSLENWEQGRYVDITLSNAKAIEDALKALGYYCSIDWLLHGTPPGPMLEAGGGGGAKLSAATQQEQIAHEITLLQEQIPTLCMTQVSDDAVAPVFRGGDFVAGPALSPEESDSFLNEVAIIQLPQQPLLVRKVIAGTQEGRFNLVSVNQTTQIAEPNLYNVLPEFLAPIVWMRRIY